MTGEIRGLEGGGGRASAPTRVGGDGPATIGVLVADRANRTRLVDWLDDRFAVVEREPAADVGLPADVDCWLVDGRGAATAGNPLDAAGVAAAPVFLPTVFLAAPDDDRPRARLWGEFDDVIALPVDQAELRGRIEALLRTRRLSLALAEERERLDSFAGFLAHDLRNPLNVAQGFLALSREEDDEAALDAVGRSLDRLEARISDALLLAREGESALEPVATDLDAVAETAWTSFRATGARLSVDSRELTADPDALERLLENLFRNAVEHAASDQAPSDDEADEHGPAVAPEHTGEGSATPTVHVRVGPLPDGFYVEDDGPGIPSEQREDVFEARVSTKRGATGLGLAIVRRLATAHGWSARVTAASGGGARFEFLGVG